LQAIHLRVHRLLSKVAVPDYLHSAVKGRSYLSNAASHLVKDPVIKIDIKKFFASVPQQAVLRFLRTSCRCRSDVAKLLSKILVFNGKIATGSSASPILAYYAFKPMFDEIAALAASLGLTFTCYVDDMTLSGLAATNATLMKVREIISRHGLKSHKTRKFKAGDPRIITGVCLAVGGHRVPNKLHLKIATDFENFASEGDRDLRKKTLFSLLGRLEAAGLIDPKYKARAATLRASTRGS
jgi:RNA-directed DNA polymerase